MPKSTGGFNPSQYATRAQRIALFRAAYPFGRIRTRLHSHHEGRVTFIAEVFRHADDAEPAATGWASEREGDSEINVAACIENTETTGMNHMVIVTATYTCRAKAKTL